MYSVHGFMVNMYLRGPPKLFEAVLNPLVREGEAFPLLKRPSPGKIEHFKTDGQIQSGG
jgi:hypothetical protein